MYFLFREGIHVLITKICAVRFSFVPNRGNVNFVPNIVNVNFSLKCLSLHVWSIHMYMLQKYKELFEGAGTGPGDKTLEDKFFEYEVSIKSVYLVG